MSAIGNEPCVVCKRDAISVTTTGCIHWCTILMRSSATLQSYSSVVLHALGAALCLVLRVLTTSAYSLRHIVGELRNTCVWVKATHTYALQWYCSTQHLLCAKTTIPLWNSNRLYEGEIEPPSKCILLLFVARSLFQLGGGIIKGEVSMTMPSATRARMMFPFTMICDTCNEYNYTGARSVGRDLHRRYYAHRASLARARRRANLAETVFSPWWDWRACPWHSARGARVCSRQVLSSPGVVHRTGPRRTPTYIYIYIYMYTYIHTYIYIYIYNMYYAYV